jgi:hypothetical protein
MSETKLSQRFTKSANDLLEQHLRHLFVSKFLMNGSVEKASVVASVMYKFNKDTVDLFTQVFKALVNKTDI